MKIMMIPGERNEELILKVREAAAECRADENSDAIDILIDEYGLVDVFDALYYACIKELFFGCVILFKLARK